MNKQSQSSIFPTALLLIFITLKLTNYIDWSWWWVLSPFWIPLCVAILIFIPYGIKILLLYKKHKKESLGSKPVKQTKRKSKFQQRLDEAMEESKKNKP